VMRAEEVGVGLVSRCAHAFRKCSQLRWCNKLHLVKLRALEM
jgi:hypothetical protein